MRQSGFRILLCLVCWMGGGCRRSPEEPVPSARSEKTAVESLKWDVPISWTEKKVPNQSGLKAAYTVPKSGTDKENAELRIFFFGTGAEGNANKHFDEWLKLFEKNTDVQRKAEKIGSYETENVETLGTYRVQLMPPAPGHKTAAVQMIKENFRMVAVSVQTNDRGNWFFQLIGPDETVQSARASLRTMIESLK